MPRREATDDGLLEGCVGWRPDAFSSAATTTKGKRRSRAFDNVKEARKGAARTSADLQRGDYIDPRDARLTVKEIAEVWLSARDRRPKTMSTYRSVLKTHVYPRFGSTPISRVSALTIEQWVCDMSRSGLAPGTVSNAFRVLKGVLQAGVRAGRSAPNPANGLGWEILPTRGAPGDELPDRSSGPKPSPPSSRRRTTY